MILLDANIIIYAVQDPSGLLVSKLEDQELAASIITKIEALAYRDIGRKEGQSIRQFLALIELLPLTEPIAEATIRLRKTHKIKTPDAVIAATALAHNLELWTHNTADFKGISGLELRDPVKKSG